MSKRSLRWFVGRSLDAAIWRPSHARSIRDQLFHLNKNEHVGYTDQDHLVAAARWLARAQDVTGDGGVSGRYSLRKGWSSSYPETTGYIVPTFLALAKHLDPSFHDRAARCVRFLREIQLEDGAFPGGELHENRTQPSVFNTAQILHGLVAWHTATGDIDAAESASRAASWLVSQQDTDGCWRANIYNTVTTYSTHASCWLAEAGRHFGIDQWIRAAERHLDWALTHVDPETGWIDAVGFSQEDHEKRRGVTHTIAYTIWGLLDLSVTLGRDDGIEVARRAADQVARRLELTGWLPGVLDHRWRPATRDYACLTGNAQMALIWFRLAAITRDARFVNAGLKALDLVKRAQSMDSADPGIRGGIPGSAPLWGDYLYMAVPNWAAKYFLDALLAKREALEWVGSLDQTGATAPADVPRNLPHTAKSDAEQVRVVLLASPESHKIPQMTTMWASWGFKPAAVVIEHRTEPSVRTRISRRLLHDGFLGPLRDSFVKRSQAALSIGPRNEWATDVAEFCTAQGIPFIHTGPLTDPAAVDAVRQLAPDLFVHAGAGILRRDLLGIPRLGTLNAHMGILPRYRGMNVTEWASLEGSRVGCTVHLINEGIDTGDILLVAEPDTTGASSILALRAIVDDAQIRLLGDVVQFVVTTGSVPARRPQHPGEGRQYFEMHTELRQVLERRLRSGSTAKSGTTSPFTAGILVTT